MDEFYVKREPKKAKITKKPKKLKLRDSLAKKRLKYIKIIKDLDESNASTKAEIKKISSDSNMKKNAIFHDYKDRLDKQLETGRVEREKLRLQIRRINETVKNINRVYSNGFTLETIK